MQKLRNRLTYANVMSTMALFLVVAGGTAFAATQLPKNSVGSKQLKKNSVNSAKVRNGSLRIADFRKNERSKLRGSDGAQGIRGSQGVPGPQGIQGPKGDPGVAEVVTRTQEAKVEAGEEAGFAPSCDAGEVATGGGIGSSDKFADFTVLGSEPLEEDNSPPEEGDTPTKWEVSIILNSGPDVTMTAFVVCAKVG